LNPNHFITSGITLDGAVTGYNQVVPKSSASMLVAISNNNPIVSVWRLGLGRVASVSTDDGASWAGTLLRKENSLMLSRTINWAIGDLSRNKAFDVSVKDGNLEESIEVRLKSSVAPTATTASALDFSKVGENAYIGSFTPKVKGFHDVLGAVVAVNTPIEYREIGINPELDSLVALSNGETFTEQEAAKIIEKVKRDSRRIEVTAESFSWAFVLAALIIFLLELLARRLVENKSI